MLKLVLKMSSDFNLIYFMCLKKIYRKSQFIEQKALASYASINKGSKLRLGCLDVLNLKTIRPNIIKTRRYVFR